MNCKKPPSQTSHTTDSYPLNFMTVESKFSFATFAISGLAFATILSTGGASAATVFSDVPPSHWAYNAVRWAAQYGIMTGPGDRPGTFDIAGNVNRAELATVLMRQNNTLMKELTNLHVSLDLMQDRLDKLEGKTGGTSSARSSNQSSALSNAFFSATLTGGQEVPSVSTTANGVGSFTWNASDNSLSYDITIADLSSALTSAHFHLGAPGVSGGVLTPITFNNNRAIGKWTGITSEHKDALLAGRIYVNVHTNNFPNGEIRGQVVLNTNQSSSMSGMSSSRASSLSSTSSISSHSSSISSNSSSSRSSSL